MKWFSFLILAPLFFTLAFFLLNYKFPSGEYSIWMMILVILVALVISILLAFSNYSFWGKIGLVLLVLLIVAPVYLCSYKMQVDKHPELFVDKFQEVNITGNFSFLNPVLNTFKLAFVGFSNKMTDVSAGIFSRLVGMRTLGGDLRCTYFPNYLLVGAFVALWIFLVFMASFFYFWFDIDSAWDTFFNNNDRLTGYPIADPEKSDKLDKFVNSYSYKYFRFKYLAIFVISYAYVMSLIPLVNQALRIITLEIFMPNWFIQSLIITFEIALGPMWIGQYQGYRKRKEALKKKLAGKVYEKATEAWFKEKSSVKLSDFAGP